MVHHTMNTSNTSAPSASSKSKDMSVWNREKQVDGSRQRAVRASRLALAALIVGSLAACAIDPYTYPQPAPVVTAPADDGPLPPALQRGKSLWTPVRWSELPGWGQDSLHEAWNAWLRGCERPVAGHAALCNEARPLAIATPAEQRAWVERRFQPYRVMERDGSLPQGLLTGYYEPILGASRLPSATHRTPLYAPPAGLRAGQPWYSRKDIDTLPAAQAALLAAAGALVTGSDQLLSDSESLFNAFTGLAVALPGRLGGVTAPAGAGNTGRMEGMAPLPAAVGRTADVAALRPARGAPPPALATGSPSAVSSIMDGLALGGMAATLCSRMYSSISRQPANTADLSAFGLST